MNPLHGEIATKKEEGYGHADRESMIFALNPTMTLKMLIVCHKEDTIRKLCRNIANIYYGTFLLKNPDEEDPEDFYYERIANDSVRVESLSFQGYTLPPFHKIGELLKDKSIVTAKIIETKQEDGKKKNKKSKKDKEKGEEKSEQTSASKMVNGKRKPDGPLEEDKKLVNKGSEKMVPEVADLTRLCKRVSTIHEKPKKVKTEKDSVSKDGQDKMVEEDHKPTENKKSKSEKNVPLFVEDLSEHEEKNKKQKKHDKDEKKHEKDEKKHEKEEKKHEKEDKKHSKEEKHEKHKKDKQEKSEKQEKPQKPEKTEKKEKAQTNVPENKESQQKKEEHKAQPKELEEKQDSKPAKEKKSTEKPKESDKKDQPAQKIETKPQPQSQEKPKEIPKRQTFQFDSDSEEEQSEKKETKSQKGVKEPEKSKPNDMDIEEEKEKPVRSRKGSTADFQTTQPLATLPEEEWRIEPISYENKKNKKDTKQPEKSEEKKEVHPEKEKPQQAESKDKKGISKAEEEILNRHKKVMESSDTSDSDEEIIPQKKNPNVGFTKFQPKKEAPPTKKTKTAESSDSDSDSGIEPEKPVQPATRKRKDENLFK